MMSRRVLLTPGPGVRGGEAPAGAPAAALPPLSSGSIRRRFDARASGVSAASRGTYLYWHHFSCIRHMRMYSVDDLTCGTAFRTRQCCCFYFAPVHCWGCCCTSFRCWCIGECNIQWCNFSCSSCTIPCNALPSSQTLQHGGHTGKVEHDEALPEATTAPHPELLDCVAVKHPTVASKRGELHATGKATAVLESAAPRATQQHVTRRCTCFPVNTLQLCKHGRRLRRRVGTVGGTVRWHTFVHYATSLRPHSLASWPVYAA